MSISEFRQLEGDLYGDPDADSENYLDRVRDQTANNLAFLSDPLNLTGGTAESGFDGLIDTVTPGTGGDAGRPDTAGDLLPEGQLAAGTDNGMLPDVTGDDGGLSFDIDIPWTKIVLLILAVVTLNAFASGAGEGLTG